MHVYKYKIKVQGLQNTLDNWIIQTGAVQWLNAELPVHYSHIEYFTFLWKKVEHNFWVQWMIRRFQTLTNYKGARQYSKITCCKHSRRSNKNTLHKCQKLPATTPAYVTLDETAFSFTAAYTCASGWPFLAAHCSVLKHMQTSTRREKKR